MIFWMILGLLIGFTFGWGYHKLNNDRLKSEIGRVKDELKRMKDRNAELIQEKDEYLASLKELRNRFDKIKNERFEVVDKFFKNKNI